MFINNLTSILHERPQPGRVRDGVDLEVNSNQTVELARESRSLVARLESIQNQMHRENDQQQSDKLTQLIDKVNTGEMSIAFCGHFSAGKSTMINTLLGAELLPSNPIPTSANVVKIKSGEPAARAYTRHHGVVTFDPTTEIDKLKKYAVDGDTIDWVEIQYQDLFLGEHASLMDTPGIDSTDAAHKIATESALHLADVVIYMMDYNHVQAEENFNFTKTLKDRGKPVYLVINMIDKHVDFELDFDSYKESVEESFATWNIVPDGIFYTSLAEPDHPENQYEEFKAKLVQLLTEREELIEDSVKQSVLYLIEEHARFLSRQQQDQREALEGQLVTDMENVDPYDAKSISDNLQEVHAKLSENVAQVEAAKTNMEKELQSLLENARLTYYSTNEAAEKYLESRKPNFKVGFLFAGKKTEEERAQRLETLLADFREKVASNLDWHFKDLMSKLPEAYGLRDDEYNKAVHATTIEITPDFLAAQVKEGAGSSEYVMNYCKDISNGIKAEYRRVGLDFIETIHKQLANRLEMENNRYREQQEKLSKLHSVHKQLQKLSEREQAATESMRSILATGE